MTVETKKARTARGAGGAGTARGCWGRRGGAGTVRGCWDGARVLGRRGGGGTARCSEGALTAGTQQFFLREFVNVSVKLPFQGGPFDFFGSNPFFFLKVEFKINLVKKLFNFLEFPRAPRLVQLLLIFVN